MNKDQRNITKSVFKVVLIKFIFIGAIFLFFHHSRDEIKAEVAQHHILD